MISILTDLLFLFILFIMATIVLYLKTKKTYKDSLDD